MADVLRDAQALYAESLEALRDQRTQIKEDAEFSDPSDPRQWDEEVKRQRETDPGGKRPCLVLDNTGQYISNVAGQVEKQPPALHAIPVGGGADKQAAEQIDGRFRHIEYASKATQHYTRALTSAARVGVGYLIVRPEYVDRALGWQEPRISSEPDPLRVVFDPWSTATDGSDATDAFILTPMPLAAFKRKWPKKDAHDFGEDESSDDRKSVLVAEQWSKGATTKEVIVFAGMDGQETSGTEDEYIAACRGAGIELPISRKYSDKTTAVKWRRMTGCDVLEESEYPADHIGVIPIYGYVGFADGRMRYCGIPRRARSPQQAYNYHSSELLVPNTIILMPERALQSKGVKELWDRSRVDRRGFMPYADRDEDGPVNQPSLMPMDGINHTEGAAQALRDIQASIGMYQANIGAESNVVSGVAYDAQKQQGEASTAHFPSHMAASLGHVGQIVLQMDARLSDTQRKQPIIGVDGSAGSVDVNPGQTEAFQRTPQGVSINPNVGKYGVRVVVGASYSTQRKETNIAFGEIMRGNKELAAVVAPFWAQTLDFPGSDKFAQAMAAMAPPAVKAILQPEGQEDAPDPAKLAQELDQCKQALQEAIQHAQDAQEDADQAIGAAADAKRMAEVNERKLDIEAYNAETKRLQVTGANGDQIQQVVTDLVNQMLSQPDPLPGDPEPGEQAWQSGQPMQAQPLAMPMQEPEPMPPEPMPPMEPPAPPAPSPELLALGQGQQQMMEMLAQLSALVGRKRRRIPVRDTDGNITEVIDSMDEGE